MLTIETDVRSLQRSGPGAIVGVLYVRLGNVCFPEAGWTDFPIILLRWWCEAVHSLLAGSEKSSVEFMEGPFRVDLYASTTAITAEGIRRTLARTIKVATTTETLSHLQSSVLSAAVRHLEAAHHQGWSDDHVESLEAIVTQLSRP